MYPLIDEGGKKMVLRREKHGFKATEVKQYIHLGHNTRLDPWKFMKFISHSSLIGKIWPIINSEYIVIKNRKITLKISINP